MNNFLQSLSFMEERVNNNIDVMPSDAEAREFQKLAKLIDPARYFTLYGCQSCINSLVKFVFDNKAQLETQDGNFIQKAKFPKNEKRTD